MSPIDDELRSLFHSRADVLAPSPDPVAGIERRAARMRRNRVAASVAGSAMVVAAIAVAVPALAPDRGGSSQVAVSPSASPEPSHSAPGSTSAVLDAQHPWAYRGDETLVAGNELASLQAEWTAKHPGATVKPLYGAVYEPSQKPEVAFVSTGDGPDRFGVATSSEAGWTWLHDEELSAPTTTLMAALPGDEAPRLLVIASPSTGDISYAPDGTTWTALTMAVPGVALHALEGRTTDDAVRVLDGNGDIDHPVFLGGAPDYSPPSPPATLVKQPAETSSAPALAARYALDPANPWKYRGATQDGTGDIVSADRKQFATDHGEHQGQQDTPLYVAHLSATTDVAVVLHTRSDGNWVTFTTHSGTATHQVTYMPTPGEDILSAYVPLDAAHGLLIGVASDQAANLVLQTGSRAEVGGSRTAGIWDWGPHADDQARLAAFVAGDIEPYSSQPAT